ncbi:SDR family oxidoreductase [Paenibacillus sp. MBLB4367]|uniref:SDR family oxidoreductase n=1 Tax=Paenibacillus sp. MBLB4367 TaxID=3384767 RepID=UPI0039083DF2
MNGVSSPLPVAIVTGASSGFGLLTATALAKEGFRVIATVREPGREAALMEEAERAGVAGRIECLPLDVTDHAGVLHVAATVFSRFGRIDVLVNNAGFALGGFAEEVPIAEWRRQFETNFFGLVAMTQAVLPHMREQKHGTIVNVSSVSGLAGLPGYAPYAASKFAVEGFSESLRLETADFGVKVVLVEPGAYRTAIWAKGFAQINRPHDSPYRAKLDRILAYSRRTAETAPDPREVADAIVEIALARSPKLRYPLGRGSRMLRLAKAVVPWKWYERAVLRMLR